MLSFEMEEVSVSHHAFVSLRGNRGGAGFDPERWNVVIGHEQAFHQFTFDHVPFHNFRHVGFIPHPIPDAFRINDDAGAIFAMIQTPRFVGTDDTFEPEALDFLFEEGVQFHGPVIGAAPSRVALGPLINANENMMLESTHDHVS